MNRQSDDTLAQIEQTQCALRDSIESARKLADDSDRPIQRHRKEIEGERAVEAQG